MGFTKMTVIAWGNKVSKEFRQRAFKLRDTFGWSDNQLNYLMACMAFESGETFSPTVVNAAGSGAVGLIQFMPATLKEMGYTVEQAKKMTAVQQLDLVEKYFRPYYKRTKTLSDMYMAILMPKYIGASEFTAIFSNGVAYRQNSGLDADKNGNVTKQEAAAKVQKKLEKGLLPAFSLTV